VAPTTTLPANGPSASQTATIALEVVGPGAASKGQAFTYEIVLRNPGVTPAEQVRVEETLQAGVRCLSAEPRPAVQGSQLVWEIGTLAAGAERRIKVDVLPAVDGEVVSCARATCAVNSCLRIRINQSALALTAVAPETAHVGENVVVQIQLTNRGKAALTHVVLRDQLPAGLKHPAGEYIEAEVGTLAAGESRSVTLTTQAATAGRQVNQVSVMADNCAPATTQMVVAVAEAAPQARAGLTVEVADLVDPVAAGSETTYEIRIVNQSGSACTNLRLIALVPEGLAPLKAEGPVSSVTQKQQVTFDSLPVLGARADAKFRVRARGVKPGDWRFKVQLTCDQLQKPVVKEESTHVYSD
jgi:uncharacterized repeat protein (TIGR01451 family)